MKNKSNPQDVKTLFLRLLDMANKTPFHIEEVKMWYENIDLMEVGMLKQYFLFSSKRVDSLKLKVKSSCILRPYWKMKLKKAEKKMNFDKDIYEEWLKEYNDKNKTNNL